MSNTKSSKKPHNVISKAVNNAKTEMSLDAKLKKTDPEIKQYIISLEAENLKLQKKLGKCEAEKTTLNNKISILQQELDEAKRQNEVSAITKTLEHYRTKRDDG